PLAQQEGHPARVFVVARHIDSSLGQLELAIFGGRTRLHCLLRIFLTVETSGAKKDNSVLNLLPAETREWLREFRHDAENSAVWAVEELGILVCEGCDFFVLRHFLNGQ